MTVVARGLAVTSEGLRAREREKMKSRCGLRTGEHDSGASGGVTIPVYLHMREKKAA